MHDRLLVNLEMIHVPHLDRSIGAKEHSLACPLFVLIYVRLLEIQSSIVSTTTWKRALSVFSVSSFLSSHNKFAFVKISYSIGDCSQKILGHFDRY